MPEAQTDLEEDDLPSRSSSLMESNEDSDSSLDSDKDPESAKALEQDDPPTKRRGRPPGSKNIRKDGTRPPLKRVVKPKSDPQTKVPSNWQRKPHNSDRIGTFDFSGAEVAGDLLSMKLISGDILSSGDHVYVLGDPVGEPFYIARVMEFLKLPNTENVEETDTAERYAVRLNWLYRPVDLHRKAVNTRELFLTMHADTCPLQSLRGKCVVRSAQQIPDLEQYMKVPSSFWFNRLWDRYIERFFDVTPTEKITNLPPNLKNALQSQYDFLISEPWKTRELTKTAQSCNKCHLWSTEDDSVVCARCESWYHMACVNPPIIGKLARGFGWSCAACNLLIEQNASVDSNATTRGRRSNRATGSSLNEDEMFKGSGRTQSPADSRSASEEKDGVTAAANADIKAAAAAAAETLEARELARLKQSEESTRKRQLWPFRYLGVHSSMEELLDDDENIYPRAASRIGPKHQAVVSEWPGQPVKYYRIIRPDRRKRGPKARSSVASEERYEPADVDRKLPWNQEMPPGYIERGSEATSTLCWSMSEAESNDLDVETFLQKTQAYAAQLDVHPSSPNFMDACLNGFMRAKGDEAAALEVVSKLTRKGLKEPTFSPDEVARFEEGVKLYGSELHNVYKHVRTKSAADVVRFYYMWKKTTSGHQIWDNNQTRASRRRNMSMASEFATAIADDNDKVTGISAEKTKKLKKSLVCRYCDTTTSREWRRGPGVPPQAEDDPITALCIRCARIWYRYAVARKSPDEVMEMLSVKGFSRISVDPENVEDAQAILSERTKYMATGRKRAPRAPIRKRAKVTVDEPVTPGATQSDRDGESGSPAQRQESVVEQMPASDDVELEQEPRSKLLSSPRPQSDDEDPKEVVNSDDDESDADSESTDESHESDWQTTEEIHANKAQRLLSDPKVVPDDARRAPLDPANYCAVCCQLDPSFPQLTCHSCGMCVHHACYGLTPDPQLSHRQHLCDVCRNDRAPTENLIYSCELCPVKPVNYAAWLSGEQSGTPDAFKRTFEHAWAHIRCAIWTPEVKFINTSRLEPVDNLQGVPQSRYDQRCSICATVGQGACVSCDICDRSFHPGCAGSEGHHFGFKFNAGSPNGQPVKFNEREGELLAVIRCKEHDAEDLVAMSEMDETVGLTALQLYVKAYKRSVVHTTGAARHALEFPIAERVEGAESIILQTAQDVANKFSRAPESTVCERCRRADSGYWFNVDEDTSSVILCSRCYWQENGSHEYDLPALPDSPANSQMLLSSFINSLNGVKEVVEFTKLVNDPRQSAVNRFSMNQGPQPSSTNRESSMEATKKGFKVIDLLD